MIFDFKFLQFISHFKLEDFSNYRINRLLKISERFIYLNEMTLSV